MRLRGVVEQRGIGPDLERLLEVFGGSGVVSEPERRGRLLVEGTRLVQITSACRCSRRDRQQGRQDGRDQDRTDATPSHSEDLIITRGHRKGTRPLLRRGYEEAGETGSLACP